MTTAPLQDLSGRRVLVVGDLILDRYLTGAADRISPEGPVPVLHVREEESRVGGAANVASNLARLGGRVRLCGVVGADAAGKALRDLVRDAGVAVGGLKTDRSRPTVQKTRLLARQQQMLRVDEERVALIEGAVESALAAKVKAWADASDVVVLSDYGKGVLTPAIIAAATSGDAEVLVDPKTRDVRRYRGAHVITPNAKEAFEASGVETDTLAGCREAARILMRQGRFETVVITRGAQGMYFRTRRGREGTVPTRARGVFDVTGAGDTVIATLALARAAGRRWEDAVELANTAAGVVVDRLGATAVTPDELDAALRGSATTSSKVATQQAAAEIVKRHRAAGRRVVFSNGCFDLLHAGHVESLEYCRAQGDFLVVAVNDDASVRRQKGARRPVQTLRSRMRMLAGLASVDLVFPFEEDTPEEAIRALGPDVLVKGEDWRGRGIAGGEFVEAQGGRVVYAPLFGDHSTTGIIDEIVRRSERGRSRRR